MKKKDLKGMPLYELIDKHMPLMLKNEKGEYEVYDDFVKMYYDYILQLRRASPGGYLDFALHLSEAFEYSSNEASIELQCCMKRFGLRDPEMVAWEKMEREDVEALERFCQSRHYVLDTVFQLTYFKAAIDMYKQQILKINENA